ncbi:CBS domain-containing protein [Streptomyces noursei]|uniref:CBS domain-containing protein n=1 Tax=Streptomyces noursei TaxID=1971 RepID=UPI00081C6B0C|nr:CBS domain-containing protein [Streptomyces noursei ATCC 11455]MCZ0993385.1 CBS domain-containing protein [Streptomyces noursei]
MATPDDATVKGLEGTTLSIRGLVSLWGFRVRDHASVPQIRLDLTNAGLATVPDFAVGSLNDDVTVVRIDHEHDAGAGSYEEDSGTDPHLADDSEDAVGMFPQTAMRVHDLPCAHRVTSITPDELLPVAMGRMVEHGYSQLPAIDASGILHGVVTWASIAHMHATGRKTCLTSAISSEYEIVNASAHLLPVLPVIRAHEFVLVRAADGRVSGIVTSADLAGEFGTVARPFFTLGEIERRLRRCLGRVYDEDDIQKVHKNKRSVDEMMFGEYIRLLNNEERWGKLGWPLVDRAYFVGMLSRVKDVRNTVMHFNAPSLRPEQLDLLDSFVSMLRLYDPDYGATLASTEGGHRLAAVAVDGRECLRH